MIHVLVGAFLCMVLPGAALWVSSNYIGNFEEVPESVDLGLRLAGAALWVMALLTLVVVGIRCMIWGFW